MCVMCITLLVISKSTEIQEKATSESKPLSDTKAPERVELPGLTWVNIFSFYLVLQRYQLSGSYLYTASWTSHHCEDNLGYSVAV